ncbi:uncharacterized protein BCR38DRAFT_465957 [Pseudomassariella vexata]|uniref:Gal80p-like C-terminal domain-containing protein n=1 Tax=Pseudomassariella vexata TaxID=1141098 RepID=A0A1Y2E1Z2_9PEZI|nr:uncharacterized protein BCR38DRAFT_465957 [Pseudomassariella vexata]ORY65560.1 hypothetical protein BCR38DRAFT_465957 [Pseudomassariella vexata]
MSPILVGIIGLGASKASMAPGTWRVIAHPASIQGLPDYTIFAVSNPTVEFAKRSIDAHGLLADTRVYGDAEDIANDPNVGIIVVSVEPLGSNVDQAMRLARMTSDNSMKTLVGLQSRPDPLVQMVKSLPLSGFIGRVTSSSVVAFPSTFAVDLWSKGAEYYPEFNSGGNAFTIYFGHEFYLPVLHVFTYVLGDFADVRGPLKTQYTTIKLMDGWNGKAPNPAYPKTATDHILVQDPLKTAAATSIPFRKIKSADENVGTHWIITGTEGKIENVTLESGFATATPDPARRSLQLKIDTAGKAKNVDFAADDKSPAAQVLFPGTSAARLYEDPTKGGGDQVASGLL